MKTAECVDVTNSTFLVQRYKKHENHIKGCAVELKVSDCRWACESHGLVIL